MATARPGCFGINQDDWEVTVKCPKDYDWVPKEESLKFKFEFPTKAPYPSSGCWYFKQDNQKFRRPCPKGETPWTGPSKRAEPETFKWEVPVATPDKPGCWWINQDGKKTQHDCPKDGEWPFRRNDCYHIAGKVVCPKVVRVDSRFTHVSLVVQARRSLSFNSSSSSSPIHIGKRAPLSKRGQKNVAVSPARPTLPGTYSPCAEYYPVSEVDHVSGCLGIAKKYGISQGALLDLNKDINAKCTNLKIGYAYCVAGK